MGSGMSTTEKKNTDAGTGTDTTVDDPRVKLPGFGLLRIHGWGFDDVKFPHALQNDGRGRLSNGVFLRERRMLDFIGTITDKPEWARKVDDDAIVAKWREEAKAMPPVEHGDVYMSDTMFNNCIAELKDKAGRLADTGFVTTLDAELAVVKSDVAVPDDLVADLRRCVAVLENVPDRDKDWHPGTDDQVLDLLHPSMFPVVFGVTRALPTGKVPLENCAAYTGKGELTHDDDQGADDNYHRYARIRAMETAIHQDKYQWLPSDVTLTKAKKEDGGAADEEGEEGAGAAALGAPTTATTATITSYINNLHPRDHKPLYNVLERFVAAAVPLWEECLTPWGDRRRFKVQYTDDEEDYYIPEGLVYQVPRYGEGEQGFHGDGNGDDAESTGSVDSDYMYTQEYVDWRDAHRILTFREPDAFVPFAEQEVQHDRLANQVSLHADQFPEGLQVIFKLANIHLTPDHPEYEGGSWHIEGTMSESICASALYYYDEDNITPSRLSFRQGINDEALMMMPAQGAFNSLECYMGVEQEGAAVQELGSVLTRPGRLLAFPNVLQHCVGPFQLQDASRPGHRKILAMFLIDPHRRVLSTANVPPQRKDWWSEHVRTAAPVLGRLPAELFDHVIDEVDTFPMSWDEAADIRLDLMAERSCFTDGLDDEMNQHTFSFCEH